MRVQSRSSQSSGVGVSGAGGVAAQTVYAPSDDEAAFGGHFHDDAAPPLIQRVNATKPPGCKGSQLTQPKPKRSERAAHINPPEARREHAVDLNSQQGTHRYVMS